MDTPEEHIDQEQDEVLLIVVAHAIVHPWTVMVHASHTTLTRWAVVALGHLDRVTLFAYSWEYGLKMPNLHMGNVVFIFENRFKLLRDQFWRFNSLFLFFWSHLHYVFDFIISVIIALNLIEYGFVNIKVINTAIKLDLAGLINKVLILAVLDGTLKKSIDTSLHGAWDLAASLLLLSIILITRRGKLRSLVELSQLVFVHNLDAVRPLLLLLLDGVF
jgi:hypothetical protein